MSRQFNGTTDYIDVGNVGSAGQTISLSAWIVPYSLIDASYHTIYGKRSGSTVDFALDYVADNTGDPFPQSLRFYLNNGSFYVWQTTSNPLTVNVWQHVGVSYDAASAPKIYVNGTLYSVSQTAGSGTPALTANAIDALIGFYSGGSGSDVPWNGAIAEVCLWRGRILSAQEFAALASGVRPHRVGPAGIVGYWPLFGLASPEPDLSGGGHNGTLTGTTAANHAPLTVFTRKARIEVEPTAGSSLSLAVLSAAWTNPGLSFSETISLSAETAAWTDPALSLLSAVSLAAESASWTDPALALASALTLGQESASWTDPGLSLAAILPLAAESASWTNPALTIPGFLFLPSQSASWTNPAILTASEIVLVAEAASWTNPALTYSTGGGTTISLVAESAAWTVNALTPAFFAFGWGIPLGFSLELPAILAGVDCSLEYQFMSNTEQVVLYRKLSDGTFDGGTVVVNALRLDIDKDYTGGNRGLLSNSELQWYLWTAQVGSPYLKPGDVIQDSLGTRWTIWQVDVQAWGARFLARTKRDR